MSPPPVSPHVFVTPPLSHRAEHIILDHCVTRLGYRPAVTARAAGWNGNGWTLCILTLVFRTAKDLKRLDTYLRNFQDPGETD